MNRFVAVFLAGAAAALGGWRSVGPFGGATQAIAVDPIHPQNLVVATKNGLVYRSVNGGQWWDATPFPAPVSADLHSLAIDPAHPETWYVALSAPEQTATAGIYKTADSGGTWTQLAGMKGRPAYAVAVWEKDSKIVVAGSDDGVWRSSDAGETWQKISSDKIRDLRPTTSLAIDPVSSDIIYAGTPHLPWKTSDGGKTWKSIHAGMIDDSDIFSLHPDANDPSRVYASACSGIYKSVDAGGRWAKMTAVPMSSRRTYIITQDPKHSNFVFAGTNNSFWRSADGGTTWKRLSDHVVHGVAFDPQDSRKMYLASEDEGVLVSEDGGVTTRAINAGFVNRQMPSLTMTGGEIYTSAIYEIRDGGIYRSRDFGMQWERVATTTQLGGENIVAVNAAGEKSLLAASYDRLLRSSDGGKSWLKIGTPWGASALAVITRMADGNTLLAASSTGLLVSRDGGGEWQTSEFQPGIKVAVKGVYVSGDRVAAVTPVGLFLSGDRVASWKLVSVPCPDLECEVRDLALNTDKTNIGLAATPKGLFRTDDGMLNWDPVTSGLAPGPVTQVAWHSGHPGEAYALQNGLVYRSTDFGLTWGRLDGDGLRGPIKALITAPDGPERLLVLTGNRGIFSYDVPPPVQTSGGGGHE